MNLRRMISETEYLSKMRSIMADYHAGKSAISYPERIQNDLHAQAIYVILSTIITDVSIDVFTPDLVAEVSEAISQIVSKHRQVGWTENKTIHDRISQDIDDLFYGYEKSRGVKLPFEVVDKIIDNVLSVAVRRF